MRLCTNANQFEVDKNNFLERLQLIDTPSCLISKLRDIQFRGSSRPSKVVQVRDGRVFHLVVPFQLCFEQHKLAARFARFCEPWLSELSAWFESNVWVQRAGPGGGVWAPDTGPPLYMSIHSQISCPPSTSSAHMAGMWTHISMIVHCFHYIGFWEASMCEALPHRSFTISTPSIHISEIVPCLYYILSKVEGHISMIVSWFHYIGFGRLQRAKCYHTVP